MSSRSTTLVAALVLSGSLIHATAPASDPAVFQFELVSGFALRAAELMPEADYSFRPVAAVRTFAQLVGHVADASFATCSMAAGARNPNAQSFENVASKTALVAGLRASRDHCLTIFATISTGGLATTLPGSVPFARPDTTMAGAHVASFTTAHTYEHYGNMVVYLRIKGLEPPSTTATQGLPPPIPRGAEPAPSVNPRRVASADPFLLARDTEIALARSAGPPEVSAAATILTLRRDGVYEVAEAGTNGFVCFVSRAWAGPAPVRDGRRVLGDGHFDPKVVAPECHNPLAVATVLEWHKMTTKMFLEGRNATEVEDAVQGALMSGALALPATGAMSYMMSPRQHLSDAVGRYRPHLMFYTPYAKNADRFGTKGLSHDLPFVTDENGPWATSNVPLAHFSDGTP